MTLLPADTPVFMTLPEVAALRRVPERSLYAWRYKGHGPKSRLIGRHLRYARSDVEAWLEEQVGSGPSSP
jgi:excisionase family DNA binding protein